MFSSLLTSYARLVTGNPAKDLFLIAVTGTTGKSTVAGIVQYLLGQLLGSPVGLIQAGELTGITHLHEALGHAQSQGQSIIIVERGQEMIAQYGNGGCERDMIIVTGVSDHPEVYKSLLSGVVSQSKPNKFIILPKDDRYGRLWAQEPLSDSMMTYGIMGSAGLSARIISAQGGMTQMQIEYLGQMTGAAVSVIGDFNVSNVLAAVAAGLSLGLDIPSIVPVLASIPAELTAQAVRQDGAVTIHDYQLTTAEALEKYLQSYQSLQTPVVCLRVLRGGVAGVSPEQAHGIWGVLRRYAVWTVITHSDARDFASYAAVHRELALVEGQGVSVVPDGALAQQLAVHLCQSHERGVLVVM